MTETIIQYPIHYLPSDLSLSSKFLCFTGTFEIAMFPYFKCFFVAILRILGKPFPCFLSSLEGKLGVKCTDTEVLAALPPIRANGKPRESSNCTFWSWEVSRQDLMAWAAHGHSSPVMVVAMNLNYATNYGNGKSARNQLHFLVESKG